jgi:hypothetical protein
MRDIEVPLDDETYRRALRIASDRGTTLSALVEQHLRSLISEEFERLQRMEQMLRDQIANFTASDRLSRDELYERRGDEHRD